jgi:hypothetical protein
MFEGKPIYPESRAMVPADGVALWTHRYFCCQAFLRRGDGIFTTETQRSQRTSEKNDEQKGGTTHNNIRLLHAEPAAGNSAAAAGTISEAEGSREDRKVSQGAVGTGTPPDFRRREKRSRFFRRLLPEGALWRS